jgi:hypothetical protein
MKISLNQNMKHSQVIIVANAGSLKAYRITESSVAHRRPAEMIRKIEYEPAHKKLSEMVTDRQGRFRGSGDANSPSRSSGEQHKLFEEMKKKSVRQLAHDIEGIIKHSLAEKIHIALPKLISADVVSKLSKSSKDRIGKNVTADIVKEPVADLRSRFKI